MGYSGAGAYSLPPGSVVADGTSADAADLNTPLQDLETAMNLNFLRDGRAAATGDFDLNSHQINNLAAGTAAGDAARTDQVQTGASSHAATVNSGGGTVDAIRLTFSPANTSLTTNERVRWTSPGANTVTAPTLSKNGGTTTKTIKKGASAALAVGDTGASGYVCEAEYNGTDWILLNPATEVGNVTAAGNNAFTGANTHAGDETLNETVTITKDIVTPSVTLTDAATIDWDLSTGTNFIVTLTASRTLGAPTGGVAGQRGLFAVAQNVTGGWGLTFNAAYKSAGSTVQRISPTASAVTIYQYYYDGSICWLDRVHMDGFYPISHFKEHDLGALAIDTAATANHGVGAYPAQVTFYLECTTTNAGYAVGDRVMMGHSMGNPAGDSGMACWVSTTQVGYVTGDDLVVTGKSTKNNISITPGSWKVIARVYE